MNPLYLNKFFREKQVKYELRDSSLLEQPKFRKKTFGFRSFRYYGSKIWNDIPFQIKNTDNLDEFKANITMWCHSSDFERIEIFHQWF